MDEVTARALAEINRAFYRDHAAAFSATRNAPWAGFAPLADVLRELPGTPRVLDVGCGNGRFARYLEQALAPRAVALSGVDASAPLLDEARRAGPASAHWQLCDAVEATSALPSGPFDLVTLLAVIHGVPSRVRRRALLAACASRLAPGGRLAFSTWWRGRDERAVDWNSYSSRTGMPIDCSQLEPGDQLIPWGPESDDVVRYFHFFDESDVASCTAGLPLVLERRYRADGRGGDQNEYFVFRAR